MRGAIYTHDATGTISGHARFDGSRRELKARLAALKDLNLAPHFERDAAELDRVAETQAMRQHAEKMG